MTTFLCFIYELKSKVFAPVSDVLCPVYVKLLEGIVHFDVHVGRCCSFSQCLLENWTWLQRWFMRDDEDWSRPGIDSLVWQYQIKSYVFEYYLQCHLVMLPSSVLSKVLKLCLSRAAESRLRSSDHNEEKTHLCVRTMRCCLPVFSLQGQWNVGCISYPFWWYQVIHGWVCCDWNIREIGTYTFGNSIGNGKLVSSNLAHQQVLNTRSFLLSCGSPCLKGQSIMLKSCSNHANLG